MYNLPSCSPVILFFVTRYNKDSSKNAQKYKTVEQGDQGWVYSESNEDAQHIDFTFVWSTGWI